MPPASPDNIVTLDLQPEDTHRLANLCGHLDSHIKQIAQHFQLNIFNRSNQFTLEGDPEPAARAAHMLERLYLETASGTPITPDLIHLLLSEDAIKVKDAEEAAAANAGEAQTEAAAEDDVAAQVQQHDSLLIKTPQTYVKVRGKHQKEYIEQIRSFDINFGIGPAGTGKTFLAVAAAVEALSRDEVKRILLVRPAVEAGEKLGFLPGDLAQKIDPYLRPLYDALYEMIGFEQVGKLMERNIIEVAPLAYMRGRTLSHSFVILDESQNTTKEQMKMFLTRVGFGSRAVITGDLTQVDLPRGVPSGLRHGLEVLDGVEGIGITRFDNRDVVRHPLVQRIVDAYDRYEEKVEAEKKARQAEQKAAADNNSGANS
ncbi:PhoH family protein [Oceanobacter mangrovi]|uniref:PhoH family protein n=1 Tax=Oceanobacter mangrovi TaxID=2862510 RepID=UPI001C8EEE47|nr:PhoH family protein [Oceanobacter mangrovi]